MSFTALRVLENREEVPGVQHIVLSLEGTELAASYTAGGQYVQLNRGGERPVYMAIASAPGLDVFEFLIQRTEGTAGLVCSAEVGDTVDCSAAMGGGFPMERAEGCRVLMFAGGTGISAVRALVESKTWDDARLYYGADAAEDMAYRGLFADWSARGVRVVECVGTFPNVAYANEGDEDCSDAAVILCGPGPMMSAVTELLVSRGMPEERALKNY
jgi:NAD(P)H-flavin reductase